MDEMDKMKYQEVQSIAKQTIQYVKTKIRAGMRLKDIREICENKMLELGADSFWYWDVGAFVFSGDETTVSISGKHYHTSEKTISNNDIITIDLSPQKNNIWGDYARTLIIEDGSVVNDISKITNIEWKNGLRMEEMLHKEMMDFVNEETTFEDLFYHINHFIIENGYTNLDFLGNLGHSIVMKSDDRIFIEKGNIKKLSEVSYFTFEPHICMNDSVYGYKKENIYYFENGKIKQL